MLRATFVPFRVHTSAAGKYMDVSHPEMAMLTRRRSTRHCHEIRLASAKMLPTTSSRLAIINASTSPRSSQLWRRQSVSANSRRWQPKIAIRKNTALRRTPVPPVRSLI